MSESTDRTPDDEPTAAERIAEAGETPEPGHPATPDRAGPSSGEQLSREGGLPVPGDDVVLHSDREDAEDAEDT